jgi:hypothetical protein
MTDCCENNRKKGKEKREGQTGGKNWKNDKELKKWLTVGRKTAK